MQRRRGGYCPHSGEMHMEWCRMSKDNYEGHSKKELAEKARRKGIAGWQQMRKDELIAALKSAGRKTASRPKTPRKPVAVSTKKRKTGAAARSRVRTQRAAAHDTGN